MALLLCPECGEKISDSCEQCIHCGFKLGKMSTDTVCLINGKEFQMYYFLNSILNCDETRKLISIKKDFEKLTNCAGAAGFIKNVRDDQKIPASYDSRTTEEVKKQTTTIFSNVPKCPTCGSTKIRKISGTKRAASILSFGILSNNIGKTYECLNCKYKW